jgi:hypothetical protein
LKIEKVLDSIMDRADGWNRLVDNYIEYPEKSMEMRMLVTVKVG